MGFLVVFLVLMILFSPAIIIVATPRRWLRLSVSIVILLVGLLWLDEHVSTVAPYDDDGPFYGIGRAIVLMFTVAAGIGVALRGFALLDDDPDQPRHPVDQAWPVPLAVLAAALFLHWLSNQLAGAQPPWAIHISLIASGFTLASFFAFAAIRWIRIRSASLLTSAFAASFAAMIVNDAAKGFELWQQAKREAGAHPHCIMTYGGWEHQRVAQDGWDLSPLVNRHYGTWAAGKAPVLISQSDEGMKQLRWLGDEFSSGELGNPSCEPT